MMRRTVLVQRYGNIAFGYQTFKHKFANVVQGISIMVLDRDGRLDKWQTLTNGLFSPQSMVHILRLKVW